MDLLEKLKAGMGRLGERFQRFLVGRYGSDDLSKTLLWAGVILLALDLFLGTGILSTLSMVLYILVLYRMFSKNTVKRAEENRKYLAMFHGTRLKFNQAKVRFKNRKEYKYVRCPNCHSWIRLPRGAGSISVRCKPCNHVFDQKT